MEGVDEEIPIVFQDLNIEDGPFSMAEYLNGKEVGQSWKKLWFRLDPS